MADKYKSPKEVAKELNLSEQTVWRMLRAGEMPAIRLRSGVYRIPEDYTQKLQEGEPNE